MALIRTRALSGPGVIVEGNSSKQGEPATGGKLRARAGKTRQSPERVHAMVFSRRE